MEHTWDNGRCEFCGANEEGREAGFIQGLGGAEGGVFDAAHLEILVEEGESHCSMLEIRY